MEKQTILAISNRKDCICYEIRKNRSYYEFLLSLLEDFNVKQLPDFYDGDKLPDATTKTDLSFFWEDPNIEITQFIGANRIFLMIKTNRRTNYVSLWKKTLSLLKLNELF